MHKNIAIFGSTGAIGNAMIHALVKQQDHRIHAFARQTTNITLPNATTHVIDYLDETALEEASHIVDHWDLVIVAIGTLHNAQMQPEKKLGDITHANMMHLFETNTVIPTLIAKHFLPRLNKKATSVFAALSARVGSISDNRLSGWYAYRTSKAALNMVIKNAAIEVGWANRKAIVVGLHPGTVDSPLSAPFQSKVPNGKLFTPEYAADCLLNVITQLSPKDSGQCFAWDGKPIPT